MRVCDDDRVFPFREGSARKVVGCELGRLYPISEAQGVQILTALASKEASADEAR
jgi:hypothetical protein